MRCEKIPAQHKYLPGEDERGGKRANGKLTMKCCEKVLDEHKEQHGEDERGGKGAAASWKG
jgi:hypothetical protein